MLVLGVPLVNDELVVEQNDFAINVFDQNSEAFRANMDSVIPAEIWRDDQVNSEQRSSYWLHVGLRLKDLVDI